MGRLSAHCARAGAARRGDARAALPAAERSTPAQGREATVPTSAWQAPGEQRDNSGAEGVQRRAASKPSGAIPSQNIPMPSLPAGCAQRYAPQAGHRVDPFGILGLVDLWPANSTARVRPRPFPVGPAYNSSEFDLFTNVSIVLLVRPHTARSVHCHCARTPCFLQCLPSTQVRSVRVARRSSVTAVTVVCAGLAQKHSVFVTQAMALLPCIVWRVGVRSGRPLQGSGALDALCCC